MAASKKTTKPTSKTTKATPKTAPKKFAIPPLFPPETTREDKLCLLSFCLGMITMATFFIIDFQIRSYFEMRRWENRILYSLQQNERPQPRAMHRGGRVMAVTPAKPAACPPAQPRTAKFIDSEYAPYAQKGDAQIEGNICASFAKGVPCPQNVSVFVNPVTTYSTEWWNKHWTGRTALDKGDPRAMKYNVRVNAEKDGDFEFDDLAAGSYYVGADMCVTFTPGKPCVPVRLGKQITVKDDTKTTLDIVFRADKP